ncbi:hypothetical protein ACFQRC_07315 [Enterovirga sp. GCM10030262]|uniref:hypothetical protein n=1 Tax=Enterovirga sp. GCM10030262 TaxID=3273391 RepID=UPI00361FF99C
MEKSVMLRFLLAFLANGAKERWPFDNFWRDATTPPPDTRDCIVFGRRQSLTNAMAGIYDQLGLKR